MDLEFPRGRGDQVEKIMEIPGGWGSNVKPSEMENPGGWGVKLEKTLRGGRMDIFWNHTLPVEYTDFVLLLPTTCISPKPLISSSVWMTHPQASWLPLSPSLKRKKPHPFSRK